MSKLDIDIIFNGLSPEWMKILYSGQARALFDELVNKFNDIDLDNTTPKQDNWFEAFRLCPYDSVCAVIIGEDPYPQPDVAHGLSFSYLGYPAPKSLKNIHKCLINSKCAKAEQLLNGNLSNWAKQGILMLNTALTTIIGISASHINIWKPYVSKVIQRLNAMKKDIKYMLWGSHAHKLDKILNAQNVMKWAHPVAYKSNDDPTNFIFCDHFVKLNEYLKANGKKEIDWTIGNSSNNENCSNNEEESKNANSENESKNANSKNESKNNIIVRDIALKTDWEQGEEIFDGNYTVIFTDGSCEPNKKCPEAEAGYAVYVSHGIGAGSEIYGKIDNSKHFASNIRAEGTAILHALTYVQNCIKKIGKDKCKTGQFVIITDCEHWLKCILHYMKSWDDNKFNMQANEDLTRPIWNLWKNVNNFDVDTSNKNKTDLGEFTFDELLNQDKDQNSFICKIEHVKSHGKSGGKKAQINSKKFLLDKYNDVVDKKAKMARIAMKNNHHVFVNACSF
jgi:uracil-DNA glycosylase